MKKFKLELQLIFATISCFVLAYASALAAGIETKNWPESLARRYRVIGEPATPTEVEQAMEVPGTEEVEIQTKSLNVNLESSKDQRVVIQAKGSLPTNPSGSYFTTQMEGKKLTIQVQNRTEENSNFRIHWSDSESDGDGDMTLMIPANIKKVTIKTVSGDIHLGPLERKLVDIRTVSGDVGGQGPGTDLTVKTVSGDVELKTSNPQSMYQIDSVSGNIHLILNEKPDFNFNFNSMSGEMHLDPSLNTKVSDSPQFSTRFGNSTAVVTIKTVSGNFELSLEPSER